MKNQKYPTVRTVLKCKIEHHRNKVNMDTPNTHIHVAQYLGFVQKCQ